MNLLYTATAYPPSLGGAQIHLHSLARMMVKNHRLQVVSQWDENRADWLLGTTLRAPGQGKDYEVDGVQVHRLGIPVPEKAVLLPWVLGYYPFMDVCLAVISSVLQRHLVPFAGDIDLVHNVRIGREGLTAASLKLARKRNVPFILTPVHHPRWEGWLYRAYLEMYRQADAVIALTEAERQKHIDLGVDEGKAFVTGNGPVLSEAANVTRFCEQHNIHGPLVLFIGQHFPYKGYFQLLQSAKIVWEVIPEAEFVFIGPAVGSSEAAFAVFAHDRRIHRLGTVDLQTKTDALAACDVFCLPSTQESFGGVYTEAWSFGKPVIGCNIPAVAEVIDDGLNGWLVSQDPVEIAAKIIDSLCDPNQSMQMGLAGKQKVAAKYSWERIVAMTETIYRQVCHG